MIDTLVPSPLLETNSMGGNLHIEQDEVHLTQELPSISPDEILDLETDLQFNEELLALAEDFELGVNALSFGPEFIFSLHNGEVLHVHLIKNGRNINKPGGDPDTENSRYVLVATSQTTGEVVGLKWGNVNRSEPRKAIIKGKIQVKYKGKGIGSAIEAVNQIVIQSIADTEPVGTDVIVKVINANVDTLQGWKDLCKSSQSPVIAQILAKKELEQANWQRIYGSSGLLGLDNELTKVVSPTGVVGKLGEHEQMFVQTAGPNRQPTIFARNHSLTPELQDSSRRTLIQTIIDKKTSLEHSVAANTKNIKLLLERALGISLDEME